VNKKNNSKKKYFFLLTVLVPFIKYEGKRSSSEKKGDFFYLIKELRKEPYSKT